MNMQSPGSEQLCDLLTHDLVRHLGKWQRDMVSQHIPQGTYFKGVPFELLKPQASPTSIRQINPI